MFIVRNTNVKCKISIFPNVMDDAYGDELDDAAAGFFEKKIECYT